MGFRTVRVHHCGFVSLQRGIFCACFVVVFFFNLLHVMEKRHWLSVLQTFLGLYITLGQAAAGILFRRIFPLFGRLADSILGLQYHQ